MATDADTARYILEQMQGAGNVAIRPMFGEYAVYCDGKVVGLICDNQLTLKPTPGLRALLPDAVLGEPYPGVKPQIVIDEALDDPALLARLVTQVAADLPPPKPKKPKPGAHRP
ncbi:TfoX/Sxy family protein [Rhodobacter ferrooxidans]|uniref:TfoX domain protein n=1 Tax=Rhodobacter ferrooxidans TaxID=371731 RepID=C8S2C6_9RHOB|nr:TfoX/Sxy family protein [Rhodobacter sp. SW2]EEW24797.1 TfoX domain protein [Rhodobacter sp. SW2]